MREVSLLGAGEIRQLASELDLTPSKSLGQNFVHDANICEKIVRLAGIQQGDRVIEVGPGLGSLSLSILRSGAKLFAVEIDRRLAQRLPVTLQDHGVKPDSFQVINKDARDLSYEDLKIVDEKGGDLKGYKIVANLPYNVSVPVILHLLQLDIATHAMVMVQSEVARRLAAKPGNKEYGVPSAKVAWYANATLSDEVPRSVFWPVPRVDSSLLALAVHSPLADESLRQTTFKVIDHAFNQRRKMLRSSLSRLVADGASIEPLLLRAGIDPTARAESVSVEGFLAIAQALHSTR